MCTGVNCTCVNARRERAEVKRAWRIAGKAHVYFAQMFTDMHVRLNSPIKIARARATMRLIGGD